MTLARYPWPLHKGSIALIMQSGGQLLAAARYVNFLGAGVRWGFSVGNGTSVKFADLLTEMADDPEVREIFSVPSVGDGFFWDVLEFEGRRSRR